MQMQRKTGGQVPRGRQYHEKLNREPSPAHTYTHTHVSLIFSFGTFPPSLYFYHFYTLFPVFTFVLFPSKASFEKFQASLCRTMDICPSLGQIAEPWGCLWGPGVVAAEWWGRECGQPQLRRPPHPRFSLTWTNEKSICRWRKMSDFFPEFSFLFNFLVLSRTWMDSKLCVLHCQRSALGSEEEPHFLLENSCLRDGCLLTYWPTGFVSMIYTGWNGVEWKACDKKPVQERLFIPSTNT